MPVVRIDAYRSLPFGSISGTFTPLGSAVTHNWRAFRITNTTDGDMIISVDGTTDNLYIPASSFVLYDITTNSTPSVVDALVLSIGTQFYVKEATPPTKGGVFLEGIYARNE